MPKLGKSSAKASAKVVVPKNPTAIPKAVTNRMLKAIKINGKSLKGNKAAKASFNSKIEAFGTCMAGKVIRLTEHRKAKTVKMADIDLAFTKDVAKNCL